VEPRRGCFTLWGVSGAEDLSAVARRDRLALPNLVQLVVLGALPAVVFFWILFVGDFGFDWRQFWRGGRDVLDGVSPYPTRALLDTAGSHLGPRGIQQVFRFPYPAGSAVAIAPVAVLSWHASAIVLAVFSTAAVFGSLWVLEVRDWRCYGAALGSCAVITAVNLGSLTPLLLLALACAWRFRDRAGVAGAALAAAIVMKVFLWPIVVWLAATRRFAAAAIAAGGAVLATLVAWAIIGFAGFSEYPRLVRRLSDVVGGRGFSLVALGEDAGLSNGASKALPWLVGGLVLLAAIAVAHRGDGDRRSFALAVAGSVLLTPIVWLHYFALLVAPIAVWRRTLSTAWLLPWLLWATPYQETHGHLWRVVVALVVAGATLVVASGTLRRPLVG
jgi:hypothetical protein